MDRSLRAIGRIRVQVYVVAFLTSWVVKSGKEGGYVVFLRELEEQFLHGIA